ncbi:MAG: YegP family protein [Erysipelotrichaceae bacterium]|nr:YegP family protein [Bacillota bacterium]MBQ3376445.1 YegP family protein [Erysipelotrichaceae bacterium]
MGKFVVKEVKTGTRFNLVAGNGEVIGVSEVYASRSGLRNGIASIRKNAPIAPVEDQTVEEVEKVKNPKFEMYIDKAGEYRFRLKARNGEIILASEGYAQKAGCKNGIESVRKNAVDSPIVKGE